MRVLIILLALLSVSGCAGMLLADPSRAAVLEPDEGAGMSPRDNAISTEIRRRYGEDQELRNYTIGVSASDGNVTLSGAVGSYDARDRAISIARRTNGVRNVDSRIVVNTNL